MKQLLLILLAATFFISCSSDDDNELTQDYTSFVVMQNQIENQTNSVAGYQKDGNWIKIADLGDLEKGVYSPEIQITDNTITSFYVFTDYNGVVRLEHECILKPNKKNIFEIPSGTRGTGVTDKTDPIQYPQ